MLAILRLTLTLTPALNLTLTLTPIPTLASTVTLNLTLTLTLTLINTNADALTNPSCAYRVGAPGTWEAAVLATLWDSQYQNGLFALSLSMNEAKRMPKAKHGNPNPTPNVAVDLTFTLAFTLSRSWL